MATRLKELDFIRNIQQHPHKHQKSSNDSSLIKNLKFISCKMLVLFFKIHQVRSQKKSGQVTQIGAPQVTEPQGQVMHFRRRQGIGPVRRAVPHRQQRGRSHLGGQLQPAAPEEEDGQKEDPRRVHHEPSQQKGQKTKQKGHQVRPGKFHVFLKQVLNKSSGKVVGCFFLLMIFC